MSKFKSVPQRVSFPKLEEEVLDFWKENDIFLKSIKSREGKKKFIFLEGPPTANGLPHPGHLLTRTVKDVVCRYNTMLGFQVNRKAGWDTHGLPVEIEVEKQLGLNSKQGIEEYGIKEFNKKCRESVFKYEKAWREMTVRNGYWIDMDDPYITLNTNYIESVWWSLKQLWDKGLIYKGHRVTPYCPRCGTSLSSHEVAQGYQLVSDPSLFVKFKIKDSTNRYFVAWTTTPWTLISNVALAVGENIEYVEAEVSGERLIFAHDLLDKIFKGTEESIEIKKAYQGKDLKNIKYERLFEGKSVDKKGFYVVSADFVSVENGSGIVHIAPAFGEDDYQIGRKYDLPLVQPVDDQGKFTNDIPWLSGKFVKDADSLIIDNLRDRKLLIRKELYKHDYPFCWRCDSPLLYYARDNWLIKMTKLRQQLIDNNNSVKWIPNHIKSGRFGDFISNVVDWSLSRERYWGTPLPIWICSDCGEQHFVGSIKELEELHGGEIKNLDLHKPMIDELSLKCSKCSSKLERVPEVIDTWYDSGSAPFAQFHYPFENKEKFESRFPVDFISEAIDQTRGWFYSLLAISTGVFGKAPYKNVVCLGHILDDKGKKMSKSKGNVIDPDQIFNTLGSDTLRWYLLSRRAPGESFRYIQKSVDEVQSHFIYPIWNVYVFFTTYARIDDYNPTIKRTKIQERSNLDKWIISELNSLIKEIRNSMNDFAFTKITNLIENFLINKLSNWYIRLSRRSFWEQKKSLKKSGAYDTLWEVLSNLLRLIAPYVPFLSEYIYQKLKRPFYENAKESIHLCDYPETNNDLIDPQLELQMRASIEIVQVGRRSRSKAKIRVRQPLEKAVIVSTFYDMDTLTNLEHLIMQELNVKQVEFAKNVSKYADYQVKPNYKEIGREFGTKTPKIVQAINNLDPKSVHTDLLDKEEIVISIDNEPVSLRIHHLKISTKAKSNLTGEESANVAVFLTQKITPELEREGLVRDLIRHIQQKRKEIELEYTDKILLRYESSEKVKEAVGEFVSYISEETQAKSIQYGLQEKGEKLPIKLGNEEITFEIEKTD
ncbi:MAG: isoleucine--tRNA ligase [Candidatus Ranarchaeia archaeon]